jgi:nicotinate phosphoribosyltransferase
MTESALFTDFYELTMAQGYWKRNMNTLSVFDMFFRRQPFNGGFSVFAGLGPLLETIENFRFTEDDIEYLDSLSLFEKGFLDYLASFRFSGDIWAMDEGSIVFPNEPLLRVHANVIEASIIEGLVLNMINFQSLIATKTARIYLASNKGPIMEFGLRRAQGFNGAMSASRAAYIGGASGTSNTLAGKEYGIPVMGTMAHSWVMSYSDEVTAFEAYADLYPGNSTFLIDTYNTLDSGIKAAITVGKKMTAQGRNFGVRLDSGDIQYLSTEVRAALDRAGLPDAKITVSNELSEEIVESLVLNGAPIDSWGIGTHMVTGGSESSFTGVYKLAARTASPAAARDAGATSGNSPVSALQPTMKLSDNPEKTTNPGVKQVWRLYNEDGTVKADVLTLEGETIEARVSRRFYHPSNDYQSFIFAPSQVRSMLGKKMENGKCLGETETLSEIRCRVQAGLELFDRSYKRILNPHIFKVALTERIRDLKRGFFEGNGR